MQEKLHRQDELSRLERLYEGKEEITHPEDISATQYIAFSKRFIGQAIYRLFHINK